MIFLKLGAFDAHLTQSVNQVLLVSGRMLLWLLQTHGLLILLFGLVLSHQALNEGNRRFYFV